jgi:hypothetical protein
MLRAIFVSNKLHWFMKSVEKFRFDSVAVFVHESDREKYRTAVTSLPFHVDVVPHAVPHVPNGQTLLGKIRFHAWEWLQEQMLSADIGWMADDDAKTIRYAKRGYKYSNGDQGFAPAPPNIFYREINRVAKAARYGGFPAFTHNFNARGHNGYDPNKPFKAKANWNGFVGFFKDSPNPFDPRTTIQDGEDYVAAYNLVEQCNFLPVLQHTGLTIEFDFVAEKYFSGRRAERVVNRFPELAYVSTNNITGVPHPRLIKTEEKRLKAGMSDEFKTIRKARSS